jgi:hypothetical protein
MTKEKVQILNNETYSSSSSQKPRWGGLPAAPTTAGEEDGEEWLELAAAAACKAKEPSLQDRLIG